MFDNIKQWFSNNGVWLLICLVCLVCGFAMGGYMNQGQVKIEEKIKVVEVEKQVVVEKEKVRIEIVKVKDTQIVERWRREKNEEKRPDGTVLTKEVEEKNIDTVVHEKSNSTEVKVVKVEKQVVVEREKIVEKKIEPILPQWHLGVLGGVSPQILPVPGINSYLVGGEVERRIVGPFFLGVWGMGSTTGQGMGGIKIGADF